MFLNIWPRASGGGGSGDGGQLVVVLSMHEDGSSAHWPSTTVGASSTVSHCLLKLGVVFVTLRNMQLHM